MLWHKLLNHTKQVVMANNMFKVTFSKTGCGTVWAEPLLKNAYSDTLSLIIKKEMVDAKNVFAHGTVTFSKIEGGTVCTECATVWAELPLRTRNLTLSSHSWKTAGRCDKRVLALVRSRFPKNGCETVWAELLLKARTLRHSPHFQKQVVDAKHVSSHSTVTF